MRFLRMFLLATVCISTFAATPGKKNKVVIPPEVPVQFAGREAVWLRTALSEEFLIGRLKEIAADFRRGKEGRMLTVPECRLRANEIKRFAAYYFFEADSGLSRKWMLGNLKFAEALTRALEKMQYLVMNKRTATEEYRQWYEYYRKTAADFIKRIDKPAKITDKKALAAQLRIKKAVLEREQAKEQAKKDAAPKLDDRKTSRKK